MMGPRATILWTAATASDLENLRGAGESERIEHVSRHALAPRIAAALPRGGVVVVTGSDAEASLALRAGADEVLRAGELSPPSVSLALERAGLRFSARAPGPASETDLGTDLLATAVASGLNAPLTSAVLDCEVLWEALSRTLYANERLADWGSLNAPIEELRELAALRASAPSSVELRSRIDKLRSSLARAGSVARTFNDLMVESTDGPDTRVDAVARSVVELLRVHIAVVGDVSLQLESCSSSVPRATLVQILSAIVANAVGALHAAGAIGEGRITVSVFEAEGAVIVEVSDNARAPGTLPLGTYGATLRNTRARLRAAGGDLMLDDDAAGKTVRAILPAADGLGAPESVREPARTGVLS